MIASLSPDELAILEAIVAGLRNREIAEKLARPEQDIRRRVSALLVKLDTRGRSEVLALIASLAAGPTDPP